MDDEGGRGGVRGRYMEMVSDWIQRVWL